MVPELAGAAAAELVDLDAALAAATAELPDRWLAIGVGATDGIIPPSAVGTFAGYGSDVRVALSGEGGGTPEELPLCALIAGWLRGHIAPKTRCEVRVYDGGQDAEAAVTAGRRLRAEIDEADEAVGVLVVADGLNTLTQPAPGGYDRDSIPHQQALDDALAAGDAAALGRLPAGAVGRVAFQVLAGLTEPAPRAATELYRGAPYGVGYFVGVWHV